ncbi:MAG: MG2 domain-containing protein, partial [Oceanihabitans sp.]
NFNIVTNNLQSYNKAWQYLEGVVRTADIISLSQAKQLVEAKQKSKNLSLVWDESYKKGKIFEFKIDSINRLIEDSKVLVKWNGKAIQAENTGENVINIPGKNSFIITKINVIQNPEQHLVINFSDPIKKQQNFDGLVSIQNSKNPKFIVEGNVLKVYPATKIVGNILVDVFQGIANTDGYKLKKSLSEKIAFEDEKPQIRLINNGVILPNSEDLKFNFEAVNLKAVDVRIIKIFEDNILQFLQDNNLNNTNRNDVRRVGRRIAKQTITLQDESQNTGKWKAYSIDLSKYIKADPGAIYRIELDIKKEYSLYNCTQNQTVTNAENNTSYHEEEDYYNYNNGTSPEEADQLEEAYWDNLTYSYRNEYYNWNDRKNPCKEAYYKSKTIAQNLLASNIGVIAKKGAKNNYYFAVTSILDTNPEAGATVSIFNFQQQEIASTKTDSEGLATLHVENHAAFAIISKGNNTSYLKLNDGNSLSISKFDVSGNRLQRGLKGYIYGERGVWRPGDTLHLSFLLNDAGNKLPKGHPVKMEITDPNGKLVYKNVTTNNLNNFYTFTITTASEDKTGNWNAKVSVGGATFYKKLKVETVKPNRLKIKVDFKEEVLSSSNPLQGKIDVKWLHGASAKNVRTEIKAKFSNAYTSFKNYKDYVFRDPTRSFLTEEVVVFNGKVDAEGLADLNNKLNVGKNAPGMLNAQFLVRAFENGGDFSMHAFNKKYAPYNSFVGLKSPKGKAYGSFFTNQNQNFDIVVVDVNGKPIKRKGLEVKIYKINWRWWWNSSYDDLASYTSSTYHQPYKNMKLD